MVNYSCYIYTQKTIENKFVSLKEMEFSDNSTQKCQSYKMSIKSSID